MICYVIFNITFINYIFKKKMNLKKIDLKDLNVTFNNNVSFKRRLDYLYENYVIDKQNVSIIQFVDLINKYYYKHAADLYTFSWDLTELYADVLNEVGPGYDIVDIGAGTGFSYNLIRSIGYDYSNYYYVEPSKVMSDRLKNDDSKLVILNNYIEDCWIKLKINKRKKIFIMNSAFHHIIDLNKFSDELRNAMGEDDLFFIPYEPNNGYNNSVLALLYRLIDTLVSPKNTILYVVRKLGISKTLLKLKSVIRKVLGKSDLNVPSHLSLSINDLVNENIVSSSFTEEMLYAVVDYGVFDNWKKIKIPDDYNEGFFTFNNIDKILKMQVVYSKTYTFQYGANFKMYKFRQLIDKKIRRFFPKSGKKICMAFKK